MDWLEAISRPTIVVIDFMALVLIAVGTIEAFVRGLRLMFSSSTAHYRREIWLRHARWLVAGLSFQLAADVIESSVTSGWEAIGHLAAIGAIRTFLNYFLERDVREVRELEQRERETSTRGLEPEEDGQG